jgi:hypothetical protein
MESAANYEPEGEDGPGYPSVSFTYRLSTLRKSKRAEASANQSGNPQAEVRTGNLLGARYSKGAQLEAKDFKEKSNSAMS